ncbi:hypothetical protein QYM36_011315 [Artemia franciscana]|uniref:Kinesin-associated microtubule-binding domain-containing protein n=2 Tax=Artemia franciscana TaxID=6661 RepID=A0AA88HIE5_ARTSF|nr:hypothetical protein QYM36_011315 [Artemia franciscana]
MELLQQVQTSEDKLDGVISLLENIKKKDFVTIKERVSNSTEEVSGFTDGAKQDASRFGSDMNTLLVDASNREKDFGTKITKLKKENFENNHAIVDRVETEVQRMGEITAQLDLDVKSHMITHETNWNAIFEATENELREYGDRQSHCHAKFLDEAHSLSKALHSTSQNHKSLIEEQRSDFLGFVKERQKELERHCSSLNDLIQFGNVAFRSRKEEVEKFLTEDLACDVPTGQTPQRREFSYPRVLAQTSPHAKILERFKLELQESNDVDNVAVPEPKMGAAM